MRWMRRPLKRRDERGVTAVFVAVAMTLMLGAVGLGVDTGSLRYQRSKVQHSADAAALAIGYDCASSTKVAECAAYQATASGLTAENSNGGTPSITPSPVTHASGYVRVAIQKSVDTHFFKVLGIDSKQVHGVARVNWTKNPISGPVLPFAISMCEYANTPVNTATVVRADLNGAAKDYIVPNGNTTTAEAYANMAPYMAPACNVPGDVSLPGNPSTVTMLQGGLWLSDAGNSTSNGKLLPTEILQSLDSVTGYFQGGSKYDTYLKPGMTLFLAVYAPTSNYQHSGLRISGGNADNPAAFDMRLVGYTPFVLSGWCFQKGKNNACATSGGAVPSSPGLAGKFVSSGVLPPEIDPSDPDWEYGDAGSDFRAVTVELVE